MFWCFVWVVWMGWCLGHWICVPYVKVPWNSKEDHTDVEAFYQLGVSATSVQKPRRMLLQSGRFPRTATMNIRLVYLSVFLLALSFLSLLLHLKCLFYCIDSTGTFNRGVESLESIMICLLFAKWIENRVGSRGWFILASGLKDRATRNASVYWCQHLQHNLNNQTKIQETGSF
jgi:hypothetical protein